MASLGQVKSSLHQIISEETSQPFYPKTFVIIGWPAPRFVEDQLRRVPGSTIVNIYPTGSGRPAFRYINQPETITRNDVSEIVNVINLVATLDGLLTPGDNFFLYVNKLYAFQTTVSLGDTFATIASRLAAAINASSHGFSAVSGSNTVTIAANPTVVSAFAGRAFSNAAVAKEVARVERRMQLTVWAQSDAHRELLMEGLIAKLSGLNLLQYADKSCGRMWYESDHVIDHHMAAGIMMGAVIYCVEYPIYHVEFLPVVGAVHITYATVAYDGSVQIIKEEDNF